MSCQPRSSKLQPTGLRAARNKTLSLQSHLRTKRMPHLSLIMVDYSILRPDESSRWAHWTLIKSMTSFQHLSSMSIQARVHSVARITIGWEVRTSWEVGKTYKSKRQSKSVRLRNMLMQLEMQLESKSRKKSMSTSSRSTSYRSKSRHWSISRHESAPSIQKSWLRMRTIFECCKRKMAD